MRHNSSIQTFHLLVFNKILLVKSQSAKETKAWAQTYLPRGARGPGRCPSTA